jgi:hypothetical protein
VLHGVELSCKCAAAAGVRVQKQLGALYGLRNKELGASIDIRQRLFDTLVLPGGLGLFDTLGLPGVKLAPAAAGVR